MPGPVRGVLVRLDLRPPLVPIAELKSTFATIVKELSQAPTDRIVYLEFGVNQGSSMLCMHEALEAHRNAMPDRLIGFDSFEGLPPETATRDDQGGAAWSPGDFACSQSYTEAYLRANGVPKDRVELVKGWFSTSLTESTKTRLGIDRADVIMIDCDIYTAAVEALTFCRALIADRAFVVFDDWGDANTPPNVGEQKAFAEFMEANPGLRSFERTELAYHPCSRVFELTTADVLPRSLSSSSLSP